ncbi:hypothetical protein NSA24_00465 [Clostridioides mangenotii]|uniref:hypothetical protein n=1 Tax=Metaclostridioides mangenotii TaxID=1540 RepID=UPI00214A11F1|nr:hypothetical protein [Clostridioides mangenotii]MCR1953300.1 hypothetical protein [Clostridioides mangenotii]
MFNSGRSPMVVFEVSSFVFLGDLINLAKINVLPSNPTPILLVIFCVIVSTSSFLVMPESLIM